VRDNLIHGKIDGANTPQTYCGITPFGHKTSSTPSNWTCLNCISGYNKTIAPKERITLNVIEHAPTVRKRGRPKKQVA